MTRVQAAEPAPSCSLAAGPLADRRRMWQRLSDRALRERRASASGMELTFAPAEGVEGELRVLASLEAQCCSFAAWTVRREEDELVLEVTAAQSAVPAVHALFAGEVTSRAGER